MQTYAGASYSASQTLTLPARLPRWLDLRRLLFLGWVTIETPGYLAAAKVHYQSGHWGIAGTRVHSLYVWKCDQPNALTVRGAAAYSHHCGTVIDKIDDDGRIFINLILEYFK